MYNISVLEVLDPEIEQENDTLCLEPETPTVNFYRFITNGILLNAVGLLGILGNIISLIILSRPQMRSSINYLLIGLARIDTVLIVTSMLLFGLPGVFPYTNFMFNYFYIVYPHLVPVVYPLATVAQTCSVYLTLTVTLERFVAVCRPLRARSLCTCGRARMYVILILGFSILYNIPRLWEAKIKAEWHAGYNTTVYCALPSEMRNNKIYVTVYVHWCYLFINYLIPFVCLAVFNAAIYKQVRKANTERQRLSRLQKREIGLATMLMCVVAVFFVCNLLPLVINIIESFNLRIEPDLYDEMVKTSNLLVTINSSVNFIIYVIFGEKFKRLFLKLFCSHVFGGRDSPEGVTNDDSLISNGDRQSLRLHRQSTRLYRHSTISRNGTPIRTNSKERRITITRAPSPGPCVYYPAKITSDRDINTHLSVPNTEWAEGKTVVTAF